jgi:thiosulfate/3-mercaptopyruvate sulfurtransferase
MKTPSIVLALFAFVLVAQDQKPNGAAINPPWTSAQVVAPADAAGQLKQSNPPQLIHVGFAVMYRGKHIPGSVYAGPGSKDAGLDELKKAVAGVSKDDKQILLYCGCCPWDHCPNMKPAYSLLKSLGYTNVKVMEIPTNFAKDWVDKGYPVEGPTAQ